jgi:hypothetical protein
VLICTVIVFCMSRDTSVKREKAIQFKFGTSVHTSINLGYKKSSDCKVLDLCSEKIEKLIGLNSRKLLIWMYLNKNFQVNE